MKDSDLLKCIQWVPLVVHMTKYIFVLSYPCLGCSSFPRGATVYKIHGWCQPWPLAKFKNQSACWAGMGGPHFVDFWCPLFSGDEGVWKSILIMSPSLAWLWDSSLIQHCEVSNATPVNTVLDTSFIIFTLKSIALSHSFSQIILRCGLMKIILPLDLRKLIPKEQVSEFKYCRIRLHFELQSPDISSKICWSEVIHFSTY